MKKDVPLKLQWIGNIMSNETTFILQELLGNCSEVGKGQEDVLEKLHLIASSGVDVMTDPRANNKKKPTHNEFWDEIIKIASQSLS